MVFPLTPNIVTIELYYSGVWNDITQYVYHRDMNPITITRGRQNEGSKCDPGKLTLELNNRDGRFSPRNPNSPLFGLIGRNTPIRVKVTYSSVAYTRITAEVSSWPSRWDVSGTDVWVPIEAWGILKRLGQGTKPLRSCMFRAMSGVAAGDYVPYVYWPLEDGADAALVASGLADGLPMTVAGGVTFAADGDLTGSDLLPTTSAGAVILGTVPAYTSNGKWVFQFVHKLATSPVSVPLAEVYLSGGYHSKIVLRAANDAGGTIWVEPYLTNGTLDASAFGQEALTWDVWRFITLWGEVSGSDFNLGLNLTDGLEPPPAGGIGGTWFASTLGTVSAIRLLGAAGSSFGHAALFTDANFDTTTDTVLNAQAMYGYDGEEALVRFARIASQVRLTATTTGDTSAQMGPEASGTLMDALRDCEDTDQGFLFEIRDSLGLQLRSNDSRYNQVPIELSYTDGHISPPFDPEPDDFAVANDREVKRRGGSSDRRELTEGPLSTQDPPDGVGRYDDTITVNAFEDDQLPHIANWRLHVGTWDAERYPRVKVDLAVAANSTIVAQVAGLDSGDLITIDNLPAWLPPETAELLIEGYEENIGFFTWDFIFNCSPAGPYNVVGRWDMTAVLHTAMNTSVTSADIATTSGPLLATTGIGSAGYGITIGGETLQVTAVAASTITYGATGAVSSSSSGSRTPGLPTGSASGNLILIFASTRNSGTGTVDTPASWTRLAIFDAAANCQVFARIYDGVWSMPTVTFTGGAANEDTIAQSIRLAGKWHSTSNILLSAASCLNTSAPNITYPGLSRPEADNCIILYFAWKQDDYTSVTSPGTEIEEASSIAGNDASQVWAYTIQTTAAAITSGTFNTTGGASAISRGAIAALRCDYQTATVTRSTNGVSASHSASDAVALTKPMRWAL